MPDVYKMTASGSPCAGVDDGCRSGGPTGRQQVVEPARRAVARGLGTVGAAGHDHRGARQSRRPHGRHAVAVGDHHAHIGMAQRGGDLAPGEAGVERDGDQPGPQRSEVGDDELWPVAQDQADPVARNKAGGPHSGRGGIDGVVQLVPGQPGRADDQGRVTTARFGRAAYVVGEVHSHVSESGTAAPSAG